MLGIACLGRFDGVSSVEGLGYASWRAAWRVFFMSMAMVMGPTPPGTGVMAAQRGATSG